METRFNKILLTAAICAMVCVTAAAQAQSDSSDRAPLSSCQSTWTRYNSLKESSSIVRSNDRNHVVHTQYKDVQTGMVSHTFIIKRVNSSTEMAFTTYFNAEDSTGYHVDVTDMRIFEDTCYFCGTKVYTYVDWTGEYVRHGIVGRFVPQQMLNGTGSLQYFEVEKTKHLTRLAISKAPGSKVLISAIGDYFRNGTACIVEMTPSSGASWELWLDTLDTPEGVVFTDIVTIRDSVRLLMQYECANNYPYGYSSYDNRHQLFMLDRFNLKGCKYNWNSHLGIYYMAHYDMMMDGDYFFHYNKAPMRFTHLNDTAKQFGVAFGVEEADWKHGGLRFFPFRHQWKYDSCIYYRMGKRTEIKEVGNLYKTATVALLSKDNIHTNGIVTLPELGTAAHDVTRLSTIYYTLNSFTQKFVGQHIDISGHSSSFGLHLLDQDITNLSLPSCFDKTTQQYTVLPGRQAALIYTVWMVGEDEDTFTWKDLDVFEPEIVKTTICEKCNK